MADDNPQIVQVPLLRVNAVATPEPQPPKPNQAIIAFLKAKVWDADWNWAHDEKTGKETYTLVVDNEPLMVLNKQQFKNSKLQKHDVARYKQVITKRVDKAFFRGKSGK